MQEITNDVDQVVAFPDPARDVITLRGRKSWTGPVEVTITDASGRVVMRTALSALNDAPLEVSQLVSGYYVITAHDSDREVRARFVKE